MKSYTEADLERLARGERLPGDVFQAIFSDAAAVDDLTRLVQVRDLLDAAEMEPRGVNNLPDMDVSFDDLARYSEGRPLDPARRAAVERFLGKHFPGALAETSGTETQLDAPANQDTAFLPPE